ncbi:MAG: glycosyltransferase family 39 protein [Candidatus Diapherotrites archaeon]|nr:glycosyltransferase family 39 protein [Candidatus Diapherotrites archaeon]
MHAKNPADAFKSLAWQDLGMLVFVVGYLVFAGFTALSNPFIGGADSASYAVTARALATGLGFSTDTIGYYFYPYENVSHTEDTWPPLQPLFLAASFLVFGVSAHATKIPNLLFLALAFLSVYAFASALKNKTAGLIAIFFLGINYLVFTQSIIPMADVNFALFNLATLAYFYWMLSTDRHSFVHYAVAGVLVGLTSSIRITGASLALVFLLAAFFWNKKNGKAYLKEGLAHLGIFAFIVALFVLPPWIASYSAYGYVNTQQYSNTLVLFANSGVNAIYFDDLDSIAQKASFMERVQRTVIQALLIPLDFMRGNSGPFIVFVLAALSFFLLPGRQRLLYKLGALHFILACALLIVFGHYEFRYMLMFYPVMCVLAGLALTRLWEKIETRERQGFNIQWPRIALLTVVLILAGFYLTGPFSSAMQKTFDSNGRAFEAKYVEAMEWIESNTPQGAVMMSRTTAATGFHADRSTVLTPDAPLDETIYLMRKYNVTYLVLQENRKDRLSTQFDVLNTAQGIPGFALAYENNALIRVYKVDWTQVNLTAYKQPSWFT